MGRHGILWVKHVLRPNPKFFPIPPTRDIAPLRSTSTPHTTFHTTHPIPHLSHTPAPHSTPHTPFRTTLSTPHPTSHAYPTAARSYISWNNPHDHTWAYLQARHSSVLWASFVDRPIRASTIPVNVGLPAGSTDMQDSLSSHSCAMMGRWK